MHFLWITVNIIVIFNISNDYNFERVPLSVPLTVNDESSSKEEKYYNLTPKHYMGKLLNCN